jgi:hypothetical protein
MDLTHTRELRDFGTGCGDPVPLRASNGKADGGTTAELARRSLGMA